MQLSQSAFRAVVASVRFSECTLMRRNADCAIPNVHFRDEFALTFVEDGAYLREVRFAFASPRLGALRNPAPARKHRALSVLGSRAITATSSERCSSHSQADRVDDRDGSGRRITMPGNGLLL